MIGIIRRGWFSVIDMGNARQVRLRVLMSVVPADVSCWAHNDNGRSA